MTSREQVLITERCYVFIQGHKVVKHTRLLRVRLRLSLTVFLQTLRNDDLIRGFSIGLREILSDV
jgi:hypothetical protein